MERSAVEMYLILHFSVLTAIFLNNQRDREETLNRNSKKRFVRGSETKALNERSSTSISPLSTLIHLLGILISVLNANQFKSRSIDNTTKIHRSW